MTTALRDIQDGGCAAWQLPYDPRSPALARSYFAAAAAALDLPGVLIDDGTVAVSELATNAHQHAGRDGSYEPLAPPELWIYPRTFPHPQLVVTVFDTRRDRLPQVRRTDLLDEHGKGLGIVAALSADTDIHPSRSRVGTWPVPGKAAWFALALPRPAQPAPSSTLRQRLREALRTAMKSRDRLAVGALRSTLAAIDNAEAVEVAASADHGLAIEQTPVGVGAVEAERRILTEAQVEQIVRAEAAALETAARDYDTAGRPERAELLRTEAQVLLAHLEDHTGRP